MTSAAWDPENVRWLGWQSILLMGGPIYVPAGPDLNSWRISARGAPGGPASGITAEVDPQGPRGVWVTTYDDERFVRSSYLLRSLLLLSVPAPVTLPYRATVTAGEAALPLGSSGRVELQLRTCHDTWIGYGRVGDRWVEVGGRGVAPDAVRLEEVTDVSAVGQAHGGLADVSPPPRHVVPLSFPDRDDYRRRMWESVPRVGGPFYVPSGPGLASWRVAGGSSGDPESSALIAASVMNEDKTSLRVTTRLDDRGISEQRMVGQLVFIGVRDPVSFPYTATVTVTEAAIPTGSAGTVPLRLLGCGHAWMGYGPLGDRWVMVESLGVRLDGLRLDEVADPSSVPPDRRGG